MYKEYISPILDRLDSETWHVRTRESLHFVEANPLTLKLLEQFADGRKRLRDDRLRVVLGGIAFDNPLLVGAGWDKEGRAVKALYTLGFAGIEIGSVVALPQPGNPKPRQFMLGPGVALNRIGFHSEGVEAVAHNLQRYCTSGIPIGISLGKNKEVPASEAPEAHAVVASRLYQDATYFVVNVSSPNTPGLRSLQDKGPLTDIVQAVNATMDALGGRKPLFVKIAPELSDEAINDVVCVVIENGLTGIIATNTTTDPAMKAQYGERWRNEAGGLSGDNPDFRQLATQKVAHIYRETAGRIAILGVGGVKDAETALAKIRAGANAVQIVTALRGEGLTLPGRIARGIVALMEQEGIKNLDEIRGIDVK